MVPYCAGKDALGENLYDVRRYKIVAGAHAANCPYSLEQNPSEPTLRIFDEILPRSGKTQSPRVDRRTRSSRKVRGTASNRWENYCLELFWRSNRYAWQLANPTAGKNSFCSPTDRHFFAGVRQALAELPIGGTDGVSAAAIRGMIISAGLVMWTPDLLEHDEIVPLIVLEAPSDADDAPPRAMWIVSGYTLRLGTPFLDEESGAIKSAPYLGLAVLNHESRQASRVRLFPCYLSRNGAAIPRASTVEAALFRYFDAKAIPYYKPTSLADIRKIAPRVGIIDIDAARLEHVPDAILPTCAGPVLVETTSFTIEHAAIFPRGYSDKLLVRVRHYEALHFRVEVYVFKPGDVEPQLAYATGLRSSSTSGGPAP